MDGSCIFLLIGIVLILLGVLGFLFNPPASIQKTGIQMIVIGIILVVSPFIIDAIKNKKK